MKTILDKKGAITGEEYKLSLKLKKFSKTLFFNSELKRRIKKEQQPLVFSDLLPLFKCYIQSKTCFSYLKSYLQWESGLCTLVFRQLRSRIGDLTKKQLLHIYGKFTE